jgi:hypothetical protein
VLGIELKVTLAAELVKTLELMSVYVFAIMLISPHK